MLEIKIKIEEIYFRIKRNFDGIKEKSELPLYLKFYLKEETRISMMGERQEFTQEKQHLNVLHDIYVKKNEIEKKMVVLNIVLAINEKRKEQEIHKNVGYVDLQLGKYLQENDFYPLRFEVIAPIQNCRDPEAYIKFSIDIIELKEFQKIFAREQDSLRSKNIALNQSQLTQKQIEQQFANQQLTECNQQLQRLRSRTLKYKNQISHLKQENQDLKQQVRDRKQAIEISQRIYEDKLDLLIRKNLQIEREFIKAKEQISDVVNMINEYGRLDIVEEISNVLGG